MTRGLSLLTLSGITSRHMSRPIPAIAACFDDIRHCPGAAVPETFGCPALRILLAAGDTNILSR